MPGRLRGKLVHILETVYPRIKERLWRFLFSLTRNPDLAEDIFQAAFEKTIPAVQAGRLNETTVVPYLFQVARNEYLNYLRKTRRETGLAVDPEAPAAQADQSARIQLMIGAFLERSDLDERRRDVLRLRLLGELAADDIAAVLKTSRRTVYRELRAGLDALKSEFERAGITPEDLR